MLRSLLTTAATGLFLALVACVGDKEVDANAGPSTGAVGDGGANDGGPVDGGPGDGVPSNNVVENADFELDCAGWDANQTNHKASTTAHTKARSCLVCGEGHTWGFRNRVPADRLVPGTTYQAVAWLRAPTEANVTPARTMYIALLIDGGEDGSDFIGDQAPTPLVTDTWQRAISPTVKFDGGDKQKSLYLEIVNRGEGATEDTACVLVDDFYVTPVTR